jgi:hypothetical protein
LEVSRQAQARFARARREFGWMFRTDCTPAVHFGRPVIPLEDEPIGPPVPLPDVAAVNF